MSIAVGVTGVNGFQGTVSINVQGSLPAGVSTSPVFPITVSAGSSQNFTFNVGAAVLRGNYPLTLAGSSGSLSGSASVLLTVSGAPLSGATPDFKKQVIYQIVTDRFFDGDPTNNNPPQSPGLYDSTRQNWQMYWGGDLAGIQQKMAYLAGMGVTAIWISPPVDNIDVAANLGGNSYAPYHGYWARDMQQIEEHFGDVNNTWTAFDNLIAAAHQNGLRVIVDFAANHSNPNDGGEYGALEDRGRPFASFQNDPPSPNNLFHHNPTISDFNYPYQLQYYTLDDLADLNQENAQVDDYLKRAVLEFMQHGADGFRLDAVKDVTWGWEYTLANRASTQGPSFLFGEWYLGSTTDPTYPDAVTFSNRSGISLLDFPLAFALRDVFGSNGDFHEVDNTITQENQDFISPNDLVTYLDSHDLPRFLSVNSSQNRLDEALSLLLACRGIPVVLYGDEQYLHNDTNSGNDPYNRVWMPDSQFSIGTAAYQLIDLMANLRQTNPALAYGTSQQRWINADVYILERQFANSVVLIAVNKSDTAAYNITGLFTALAPGSYSDYLKGLMGGFPIQVSGGSGGNNPVTAFNLAAHTVAVWQAAASTASPVAASVGPWLGQAGITATIAGQGFGSSPGTVMVGTAAATVQAWSDSSVIFTVPQLTPGQYNVSLQTNGGASNGVPFAVLTGPQIPVTFTVNGVPEAPPAAVYLTGNVVELGNMNQNPDSAVGLLYPPGQPVPPGGATWFVDASVPAGTTIQFTFFATVGGSVIPENVTHTYTVPSSGVGSVTVNW